MCGGVGPSSFQGRRGSKWYPSWNTDEGDGFPPSWRTKASVGTNIKEVANVQQRERRGTVATVLRKPSGIEIENMQLAGWGGGTSWGTGGGWLEDD